MSIVPPETAVGSSRLAVGEPAVDVVLTRVPDATPARLSALWQSGPAALVFLRHFGCIFCREQVAQLHQDAAEFARRRVTIALITVGSPDDTDAFFRERDLPSHFLALADPEKRAYQAYGLTRASTSELFAPQVWAKGFRAALHGHFIGMPKGDPFQMPGLFLVDTAGVVRYAHRHRDAGDNPPNAELFAALDVF